MTRADPWLPEPPDDAQRVLYADAKNRFLVVWQLLSWTGLTLSLVLLSLGNPYLWPFLVWAGAGAIYFALSFAGNTTFRRFDLARHDLQKAELQAATDLPSIDIFLPNCGESVEVLANTFRHVAALEWAGDLSVLCLDDVGRTEVEDLAAQYGFRYLSRPNKGEFKKAGNLRHGYLHSTGDFIVVFDADFVPRPDFLYEFLPYALEDPTIAIVQSPQYFTVSKDKSWLENGSAAVQEFFYRSVMPGRDTRHSPICVGTNAVYRRSALELTDGGALVENSEDVHTGFDLMAKGFRTKYVPIIAATGLTPDTFRGFFNQQHRWCSGSMSLLFSHKFWHERIGLRARLTFLTGMAYYVYTGLAILVTPLPALVLLAFFPQYVHWWNYALLIPALLQNFVILPRWHQAPYGLDAMRVKIIYSWSHLYAFRDRLVGRPLQWSPTGGSDAPAKTGRLTRLKVLLVAWPLLACAGIVTASAINMQSWHDVRFGPAIVLSVINAIAGVAVLQPIVRPSTLVATEADEEVEVVAALERPAIEETVEPAPAPEAAPKIEVIAEPEPEPEPEPVPVPEPVPAVAVGPQQVTLPDPIPAEHFDWAASDDLLPTRAGSRSRRAPRPKVGRARRDRTRPEGFDGHFTVVAAPRAPIDWSAFESEAAPVSADSSR